MQLSRVLGYRANKSGINAWLDGIRGNLCVPVVRLQQVKGNTALKHHLTRIREKIDGVSEGCARVKGARESHFGCVSVFFLMMIIIIVMRFLPTEYFSLP